MNRTFHVLLVAGTALRYGRAVTRGVSAFANEHADWRIDYYPPPTDGRLPAWFKDWRGDGILIHTVNQSVFRNVLEKGCATVSLAVLPEAWVPAGRQVPMLGIDPRAVAEMAASFLLGIGCQRFAFAGYFDRFHAKQLEKAFRESLARRGIACEAIRLRYDEDHWLEHLAFEAVTPDGTEPLAQALQRLPRETAVLACDDYAGCQVLMTCRDAGLRVPEQLVVMGIENDSPFCRCVRPNLTSIEIEPFEIGYKAAEELDRILRGATPAREPSLFPPQRVADRASTDILIATDVLVQEAIRLIRQFAAKGLSAKELVQKLGVSRTRLENLFRRELHQTVHEVLTKHRMAEASRLLLHTSLPQAALASQCGFVDNSHFSRLFRKRFGTTPGQYRSRHARADR